MAVEITIVDKDGDRIVVRSKLIGDVRLDSIAERIGRHAQRAHPQLILEQSLVNSRVNRILQPAIAQLGGLDGPISIGEDGSLFMKSHGGFLLEGSVLSQKRICENCFLA